MSYQGGIYLVLCLLASHYSIYEYALVRYSFYTKHTWQVHLIANRLRQIWLYITGCWIYLILIDQDNIFYYHLNKQVDITDKVYLNLAFLTNNPLLFTCCLIYILHHINGCIHSRYYPGVK